MQEKIPLDNLGNFDHLVDFEKFSENKNSEWINKINLKKKVVKNTGDNFKTSLRIKNLTGKVFEFSKSLRIKLHTFFIKKLLSSLLTKLSVICKIAE